MKIQINKIYVVLLLLFLMNSCKNTSQNELCEIISIDTHYYDNTLIESISYTYEDKVVYGKKFNQNGELSFEVNWDSCSSLINGKAIEYNNGKIL